MKKRWLGLIVLILSAGICLAGTGKATINAGALKSDLLNNGFIGDTTGTFDNPAGFFPYHDFKSLLKVSNLWVGGSIDAKKHFAVSSGYISNLGVIANEWSGDQNGIEINNPGIISPLELHVDLYDTNSNTNQGIALGIKTDLTVHQWGYAPLDKFYILDYKLSNIGGYIIDSMYAGLYHLPNIFRDAINNSSNLDFCGFDNSPDPVNGGNRGLLWVTADSGQCDAGFGVVPPYLGVRLLEATSPSGGSADLSGVSSWAGVNMEPYSDANKLNPYNKYYYLSRGKFDAGEIRKVHAQKITDDSLHINLFGQVITDVEGIWDLTDTNHLGTNYYNGGSYDSEMGLVTLGTPKQDKTVPVEDEECWPTDTMTLMVTITPIATVLGVYDNPLDTGINYYTGGSFISSNGTVNLGIPYLGGAQLYVDYSYKVNNVIITYNCYYNKIISTPWDASTLQIDPTRVQSIEGVYWAKDSSCSGTNYFIGGTFDKSSGMISLASPIDADTMVENNHYTYTYDISWLPTDDTVMVDWMDPTKVIEIISVLDASSVDHYPGGSYDSSTGTITLGIPFGEVNYNEVWVSYRYLATPNVWVKNFAPEITIQNMVSTVGPWDFSAGDSAKAVFAVVAGNSLAELQSASDSAKYIWGNPSAIVATNFGSLSGKVERTENRGTIPGAKIVLYGLAGTAVDSAYSDAAGKYFMGNVLAGDYDSLVASAQNFYSAMVNVSNPIEAAQNMLGMNFSLTSLKSDLSGYITRADGMTPLTGAVVYIKGNNKDSAATDESGLFAFGSLETCTGDSLIFTAPNCIADTLFNITLVEDSSIIINHIMHSMLGWIDGKVTKGDGLTPISGISVQATSATDTASSITNTYGDFSISGLPTGMYSVSFSGPLYANDSITGIQVSADSTSKADISLKQENNMTSVIWEEAMPLPSWRYGAASCIVNGKIYVFGGRDYLGATSTTYCYNPDADTNKGDPWTVKASMPTARYGIGAASIGDSIVYVVGGYDNDSTPLATIEAYVPATDTWITGLVDMPTPRAFLGVTSISDTVYAAGGLNNVYPGLDTVEAYLPGSSSWVTLKALLGGVSFGRAGMGLTALDSMGVKRIFCMGGLKVDGLMLQNNIKYNPITNSWLTRSAIPWYTAFNATAAVNDSIYLVGGKNNSDGYLSKVGVYNQFANNWSTATEFPYDIAYHSAIGLDSVGLWVIGGKTGDNYITDQIYMGYKLGAIAGVCSTTTTGPLEGATVSVYHGSQLKNTDVTDMNGNYLLAGLKPGTYDVQIFKSGLMDTTIVDVVVRWGATTYNDPVTGVSGGKPKVIAPAFVLHQAYPNPSRGYASINYQIPSGGRVELSVYNVLGQRIRTLVSGYRPAGIYSEKWTGINDQGATVANGIYMYRLNLHSELGNRTAVRKLVLVR
jgi:hypothetical protein